MIDMAVSQSLTARLAVGVRAGKRAAGRDGHERTRTVPMRLWKAYGSRASRQKKQRPSSA